jgi:hypothetical protein
MVMGGHSMALQLASITVKAVLLFVLKCLVFKIGERL